MDLNILKLICFLILKKESISSIQFHGKIINMMLPSNICINFYTQVFNITDYYHQQSDDTNLLWCGTPQFIAARPDSYPFIDHLKLHFANSI